MTGVGRLGLAEWGDQGEEASACESMGSGLGRVPWSWKDASGLFLSKDLVGFVLVED